MKEPLSFATAHKAGLTALNAAKADGRAVCVTVVNRSGVVKLVLAEDGAGLIAINTSRRKAYTAALTGMTTKELAAVSGADANAIAMLSNLDPLLLAQEGGLPIKVGDEVIGGIGVGGAEPHKDAEFGQKGLASVASELK